MTRIPSSLLSIPLLLTLCLLVAFTLISLQPPSLPLSIPVLNPIPCPSCLLRHSDHTGDDDRDRPFPDDNDGIHSTHCFRSSSTLPLFVRCTAQQGPSKHSSLYDPHIPLHDLRLFHLLLATMLHLARRGQLTRSVCHSLLLPHHQHQHQQPFSHSSNSSPSPYPHAHPLPGFTTIYNDSLCILVERDPVQPPSKGHGLFIVNNTATRELVLMTPHAVYDVNTDLQSATVFTLVGARALVVSTTHRYANLDVSDCQRGAKSSDMAHNVGSYFHAAAYAVADVYRQGQHHDHASDRRDDFTVLQFHGMGASSCHGVDAYITPGLNHSSPNDYKIRALQQAFVTAAAVVAQAKEKTRDSDRIDYASINIAVPGGNLKCRMNGVTNVQGRVLNGVPMGLECDQVARASSGHFVHIEQKWILRLPPFYDLWAQAIRQVL